jgi:heavy metal sensor kinase
MSLAIPRFRSTLAFRLTLWYAGIFAISSCLAFVLFYALITSVIRLRTDQELLNHANQFSVVLSAGGLGAVEEFAVIEAQAAGVQKVFFRLLYPNGQAFASTNMSYWKDIGIRKKALERLAESGRVFDTIRLEGRRDRVRILYFRMEPGIILQLGQSLESDSRIADALKGMFLVTTVFLIALSAGAGWFMAKRAVSGVEDITRTARKISGRSLEERVPVKATGDEIDQLATTFNEMLDRIEKLVREIREMTDNIAHDLKSPITRIRGLAEVTLTTGKSMREYESMTASTIEECDRLLDMINTMLLISKTEARVDPIAEEQVDLSALVRSACELFEPMAEDGGVHLACRVPEALALDGDPRMLQRMFANLFDNAIKYTLPGGGVTVTVLENENKDRVTEVKDTGVGIAPEDLPRVFDRFYRCDRSRSKPGIGLGLSLARAIARAHGGDITVDSRVDKGSTFRVILPSKSPHVL